MQLTKFLWLVQAIILLLLVKNEGRSIGTAPGVENNNEFTMNILENSDESRNQSKVVQKVIINTKIVENENIKNLMENLLLKSKINGVVEQLLPLNYHNKARFGNETIKNLEKDNVKLSEVKSKTEEPNKSKEINIAKNEDERQNLGSMHRAQNESKIIWLKIRPGKFMSIETNEELKAKVNEERAPNDLKDTENITNLINIRPFVNTNEKMLPLEEAPINITRSNNTKTKMNTSQRHATISLQIYSISGEDGLNEHLIDRLNLDVKNIGSNETLKEQLEFLQKNAENIKNQQHIYDDKNVYIGKRYGNANENASSNMVDGLIRESFYNELYKTADISEKLNEDLEIHKTISVTNGRNELIDDKNNANTSFDSAQAVKSEKVNTAANAAIIAKQQNKETPITEKLEVKKNTLINQQFSEEYLKLSEHINDNNINLNFNKSATGDYSFAHNHGDADLKENQKTLATNNYKSHEINQPTLMYQRPTISINKFLYNSSTEESLELPKPILQSTLTNGESKVSNNSSNFTQSAYRDETKGAVVTKSSATQISRQPINKPKHADSTDIILAVASSTTPQESLEAPDFQPTKTKNYFSASLEALSPVAEDNVFLRLNKIFDEYAVPISSVVKQLSLEYDLTARTPMSTQSVEPTKLEDKLSAEQTEMYERPDALSDHTIDDETEATELGYGSGYSILQSQADFSKLMQQYEGTSEEASDEKLTMENISQEETNSEEECDEMCAYDLAIASAEYEPTEPNQKLNEDDENEESNESEAQEDNPSTAEKEIKNSLTTNTTQTSTIAITTLPFTSNLIANEPTNNLEQLEVAIGNFVRKEIENIDKTNEMQVATTAIIQQQQQQLNQQSHNALSPAEGNNNNLSTALQQTDNKIQWSEITESGAEYEAKIKMEKPEVMCNKAEIIKNEQENSKTNENDKKEINGSQNEDGNENEKEKENEKTPTKAEERERVLLGQSVSYTISCHIAGHEETTPIEMDEIQVKIIKNQQQLTITSADDNTSSISSTNVMKVRQQQEQQQQPIIAGPAHPTTNRVWDVTMQDNSVANKMYDGAAKARRAAYYDDKGVTTVTSAKKQAHTAEDKNEENSASDYTNDNAGNAQEIDVASDTTANDVHQSNVAQLWQHVNGIQSLVARQTAEMPAAEQQLTSSLETDNDKTYEYDAQQPLEDGLSVRNATQAAPERVTVSNGSKENNKQRYSSDESVDGDVDDNDDREDIYDGNEDGQVDYDKN